MLSPHQVVHYEAFVFANQYPIERGASGHCFVSSSPLDSSSPELTGKVDRGTHGPYLISSI